MNETSSINLILYSSIDNLFFSAWKHASLRVLLEFAWLSVFSHLSCLEFIKSFQLIMQIFLQLWTKSFIICFIILSLRLFYYPAIPIFHFFIFFDLSINSLMSSILYLYLYFPLCFGIVYKFHLQDNLGFSRNHHLLHLNSELYLYSCEKLCFSSPKCFFSSIHCSFLQKLYFTWDGIHFFSDWSFYFWLLVYLERVVFFFVCSWGFCQY